jgi:hypothetical protein
MALKLHVGLSRKVGLPRYGSLGASCAVEVELDQGLLFHDVDAWQARVQEAFAACRQAVAAELGRQEAATPEGGAEAESNGTNGNAAPPQGAAAHGAGPNGAGPNGAGPNGAGPNGAGPNGAARNGQRPAELRSYPLPATQRQIQALDGIALRHRIDLRTLLHDRFGKQRLYDLTRGEASRLMDELQRVEHGASIV